jgi:integrase
MALFLRGKVWYMEYRTRKFRKVVCTGLPAEAKEKANAVYSAFRLAMGAKPKRSAMEGILAAIYDDAAKVSGIPVDSMWHIYEEWCRGKGRIVAHTTLVNRRNLFARFQEWAKKRKALDISDVTVAIARDFIVGLNKTNKTQRTYCGYLSQVWDAVGQLHPGIHNPWKAATPDNDGSSVRHEIFSDAQLVSIFREAKKAGHDWYLACMVALYTGLRYGNIATMQIDDIDFEKWIIGGIHNKTRRSSGIEIFIPVADPLKKILAPFKGKTGFLLPEHGIKYTAGKNPQPMDPPFSAILASAGITGTAYGFHSFRHCANSRMAEAGVPSEIRQILCGWTNDAMARHYDHAKHIDELRNAVSKI